MVNHCAVHGAVLLAGVVTSTVLDAGALSGEHHGSVMDAQIE